MVQSVMSSLFYMKYHSFAHRSERLKAKISEDAKLLIHLPA